MASRLLARSKTLALTLTRSPLHPSSSLIDPISSSAAALRGLYSLSSLARSHPPSSTPAISSSPEISSIIGSSMHNFGHKNGLPHWPYAKAQGGLISQMYHSAVSKEIVKTAGIIESKQTIETDSHGNQKEVTCFSPLEAVSTKSHRDGLAKESKKIKTYELSQKITFALIPLLLIASKSSVTTSLLVFSVYWQIYGYFKEIFLDYVHHEVTRAWVLVYFKVLLLILAKDTIITFGLV